MVFQVKGQSGDDEDPFERQRRIDWWDQNILRRATIMVVGAGALGNETLKNLALLGVGRLFIVDFDTISGSNLSRTVLFRRQDIGREKAVAAAEATRQLALEATAKIASFHGDMVWDLGLGVYRRMDVVLGCVDNDEARLATNRACRSIGIPWINAGIHGLSGNIMVFGSEGVCYECNVTPDQIEDAHSRYDSCENVRKRFLQQERMPTVQVTSALISALQVQEAIKLLHNQQPAIGKRIVFNGLTNGYSTITLQPLDECLAHGCYGEIYELPLAARTTTLAQLFEAVEDRLGPGTTIDLARRFILEIRCRFCGRILKLMRPAHRIFDDELICQQCHEMGHRAANERVETLAQESTDNIYVKSVSRLTRQHTAVELLSLTLRDLGVPPLQIISATDPKGRQLAFELTADVADVLGELA
ncbi:MAG: ThiF family adenylyltransferase [Acidobacteriota bacterium]